MSKSNGKFTFVYYEDHGKTVTNNFRTFLDNDLYIDLIFVCQNNKKVGAHQIVLGCLSNFFYTIFIDNMNTTKEKVLYINVPDIRAKIMKYILQFIYTGKAMLNKEELAEFNEDIKLLGMPLSHFTEPNEATGNKETPASATAESPRKFFVPSIVRETVDLTDTSTNVDQNQSNGNTDKIGESSSRVAETPAEATVPAALPTASVNASHNPTPPLIDKNPPDNNPSPKRSVAENRTTNSNNSSDVTAGKSLKGSQMENPSSLTSSSCSSDVTGSKSLKNSVAENRVPLKSSSSSATTTVAENKSNGLKSEPRASQVSENNVKKLPHGDCEKRKSPYGDCQKRRNKDVPPPPKRGKYLTASIDLSDDDDDVITIS